MRKADSSESVADYTRKVFEFSGGGARNLDQPSRAVQCGHQARTNKQKILHRFLDHARDAYTWMSQVCVLAWIKIRRPTETARCCGISNARF